MKNHALVPLPLITSIANLRHGGTNKIISSLLRDNLLSHECRKQGYDGYRITNAGYDILALQNLKSRGFVAAFGKFSKYPLSFISLAASALAIAYVIVLRIVFFKLAL
jgi:RIO-like serine/threonine protein kinase